MKVADIDHNNGFKFTVSEMLCYCCRKGVRALKLEQYIARSC